MDEQEARWLAPLVIILSWAVIFGVILVFLEPNHNAQACGFVIAVDDR